MDRKKLMASLKKFLEKESVFADISLKDALEAFESESDITWREAFRISAIDEDSSYVVEDPERVKDFAEAAGIKLANDWEQNPDQTYDSLSKWFDTVSMEEADRVSKKLYGSSLSNFLCELIDDY